MEEVHIRVRLRPRAADGTWDQVFTVLLTPADADDDPASQPHADRPRRKSTAPTPPRGLRRDTLGRCINKLKQWRGLATSHDKNATIYRAGFVIAAIHT